MYDWSAQNMSEVKRYLVMVDKQHREKLLEMTELLQEVGCHIEKRMDKIGILAVTVDVDKVNQLKQIEGVANIASGDEEFKAI